MLIFERLSKKTETIFCFSVEKLSKVYRLGEKPFSTKKFPVNKKMHDDKSFLVSDKSFLRHILWLTPYIIGSMFWASNGDCPGDIKVCNKMPTMMLFGFACLMAVIGYVANIVTLINHVSDPINLLLILRIVGIFAAPLGAILGYF